MGFKDYIAKIKAPPPLELKDQEKNTNEKTFGITSFVDTSEKPYTDEYSMKEKMKRAYLGIKAIIRW